MNVMREKAHQIKDETIAFRRDRHMHPEASFQEFRTTDKVAAALDELGVSYRRLEPTGLIAEDVYKRQPPPLSWWAPAKGRRTAF